jgi:reductive dehalogenase
VEALDNHVRKTYEKLKALIGPTRIKELLEERKKTVVHVSRRSFLASSALALGLLGSLIAQRANGVLSGGDLEKSLALLDRSALEVTTDVMKSRDEYLNWLGVKKVDRPTYERYIVQDPLPPVDSAKLSFGKLTPEEEEPLLKRFPPKQADPATMDVDTRIIFELGQALRVMNTKIYELQKQYRPVSQAKLPVSDPSKMAFIIKKFGTMLGAAYIGITKTKPNIHISTSTKEYYENTIVIAEAQPLHWTRAVTAPGTSSPFSSPVSFYGYSRMAFNSQILTEFIRGLGYNAFGHGTEGIFLIPMAIDAGVGEAGRIARVVAPDYGATIRLAAVTTDLPLEYDKPISFNLHEFCMRCEICADVCPSGTRPYGPPGPPRMSLNRPGMNFWYDGPGCRAYWNAGGNNWSSCYRCHAFCPWSEPRTWYHDLAKWAAINTGSVGIDMLVSMAKGDLHNLELKPSEVLWDPKSPAYPIGQRM